MDNNVKEKLIDEVERYNEDEEIIELYSDYTKQELERNTDIYDAREEGINEGIEQGRNERNIEIAKNLLNENISIDIISKTTGLAVEEIQNLK